MAVITLNFESIFRRSMILSPFSAFLIAWISEIRGADVCSPAEYFTLKNDNFKCHFSVRTVSNSNVTFSLKRASLTEGKWYLGSDTAGVYVTDAIISQIQVSKDNPVTFGARGLHGYSIGSSGQFDITNNGMLAIQVSFNVTEQAYPKIELKGGSVSSSWKNTKKFEEYCNILDFTKPYVPLNENEKEEEKLNDQPPIDADMPLDLSNHVHVPIKIDEMEDSASISSNQEASSSFKKINVHLNALRDLIESNETEDDMKFHVMYESVVKNIIHIKNQCKITEYFKKI